MSAPVNVANGASVTATSSTYPASNVVDQTTRYADWRYLWLSASGNTSNQNLDFDFGSVVSFNTVEVIKLTYSSWYDASVNEYYIYVSDDGVNWGSAIASGALTAPSTGWGESEQIDLGSVQNKRYMRFNCYSNHGNANYIGVAEIRVFNKTNTNLSVAGGTTIYVTYPTSSGIYLHSALYSEDLGDIFWSANWQGGGNEEYATMIADVDFGSQRYIKDIELFATNTTTTRFPGKWALYISDDGTSWRKVEEGTLNDSAIQHALQVISLSTTRYTRYMRLHLSDPPSVANTGFSIASMRIWEEDPPSAPAAPTNVRVRRFSGSGNLITWSHSDPSSIDHYEIWQSDETTKIADTDGDDLAYWDTTEYAGDYKVKAVDDVPVTSAFSGTSTDLDVGGAGFGPSFDTLSG